MHNCLDTNIVLKIFVHINLLIPDFYNNVSIDFIEMRVDCQREAQLLSQSHSQLNRHDSLHSPVFFLAVLLQLTSYDLLLSFGEVWIELFILIVILVEWLS